MCTASASVHHQSWKTTVGRNSKTLADSQGWMGKYSSANLVSHERPTVYNEEMLMVLSIVLLFSRLL